MGDKIIFGDQSKMSLVPIRLVKSINKSDLKIEFFNGSTIQIIGSDRYDSMRGTNPIGVVFSEYGFQHPLAWETIRPILVENGGWALFESTPNGKNHFYELLEQAKGNDKWKTSVLPVNITKSLDFDALMEEKNSMDPILFAQEYLCSFDVGMVGSYYSEQIQWLENNGRIGSFPHDPGLPVETHWDLGISDATAIWFCQKLGSEIRVIDCYEATNKGFDEILTDITTKPYRYSKHFLPHDFQNKELMLGESRQEYAQKRGFKCEITPRATIDEGIDISRRTFKNCFFNRETTKTGIRALQNYHREYDQVAKIFKNTPKHDWSSHLADSFRYMSINSNSVKEQKELEKKNHVPTIRELIEADRKKAIMRQYSHSPYSA